MYWIPGWRSVRRALGGRTRGVGWHSALVTALSIGGASPVVSGCIIDSQSCTDIGCISGATARFSEEPAPSEAKHVRVCLNEHCREVDYTPGSVCVSERREPIALTFCVHSPSDVSVALTALLGEPFADGDTFDMTIEDESGEEVFSHTRQLRYERSFPNGRECGPECLDSSFEL